MLCVLKEKGIYSRLSIKKAHFVNEGEALDR